jgi:hypothetical protein
MITSVGIRWDDYWRRVKGTVSDRCVVIVDPISRRGTRLHAYLPYAELLKTTMWDPMPLLGQQILSFTQPAFRFCFLLLNLKFSLD